MAASVSVPRKFSRCAAPPMAADSLEETPRNPKSCSLKGRSEGWPVRTRALPMSCLMARGSVATVIGYQTLRRSVSAQCVSRWQSERLHGARRDCDPTRVASPIGPAPVGNGGGWPYQHCNRVREPLHRLADRKVEFVFRALGSRRRADRREERETP